MGYSINKIGRPGCAFVREWNFICALLYNNQLQMNEKSEC